MTLSSGFRFRALTPAQEQAAHRMLQARVPSRVVAAAYGVSTRTINRVAHRAPRQRFEVEVAGYRATFELEDVPVQVTPWVPA